MHVPKSRSHAAAAPLGQVHPVPDRLTAQPPFVGREHHREVLERALADAHAGAPRVALITGDAGVGKSRLLKELRRLAERGAVQVLVGRCAEGLPLPYLPIVEALERPLRGATGGDAGALGRFFRHDGSTSGAPNALDAIGSEQLQLFRAIARAVIDLAQQQPTMLVLEDLHWADRSTLDLLQHVIFAVADAATQAPVPLMVVATYRPTEGDERLARAITRLRREDITLTVELAGLDEGDIDTLLHRWGLVDPSHQLVAMIAAVTRGNPLFIQELLHDLVKRGALRRRGRALAAVGDIAAARLPIELTGIIAARAAPLSVRCREVLVVAALLGSRFSLRTLAAVANVPADELLPLLEEAGQHRLLVSAGAEFEFAHPLVRHVLASDPNPERAQRLHRQIADRLARVHGESGDDRLLEITHHLIAAGASADTAAVLAHATRAGDRALAVSAWADAARYFEAALAAADSGATCAPAERAALHHRAAFAYSRDLDADPSLEQYELAIAAYRRTGDARGLARAVAEQTRTHVMLASAPYGALLDLDPLHAALAALGDTDPLRATCLSTLALAHWTARQPAEAEAAARAALVCGSGDDRVLAEAYHALALAQLHAMRQEDALASWEYSRTHAQRAGDRWLEGVPLQRIPSALLGLGRLREAAATADTAVALGRETQNWAGCSVALGTAVLIAAATGEFAVAETRARETLTMVRRARYGWAGPYFLPALAGARAVRGATTEAADALEILVTPGQVFDDPGPAIQLLAWVYQQLVRAHAGPIDDDTRRRLRRLANAGAAPEIVNLAGFSALVELGDWLEDSALAAAPYAALRAAAERGVVFTIGWSFLVARVLGVAAAHARDWESAETHLSGAALMAERIGALPELARTRFDHARMLVARGAGGDRNRARALLEQAAAGFTALDMAPLLERCARLGDALGVTLPGSAPAVVDAAELSRPEFDVLQRIAQGRGVREIADELTVTPASAEQRIRTVLHKIGMQPELAAKPGAPRAATARAGAAARPTHPLVIMFTDMEGSTAAIERLGDAAAHELFRMHDAILRAALVVHGGAEVSHTGDGLMATFRSASGALACAIAIQRALARHSAEHPALAVRVRIGLNAGEPIAERELVFGAAVHAAARICARARGEQILVSEVVRHLAAGRGVSFIDRGRAALKGFRSRFRLFEVPWAERAQPPDHEP
jgi:class 3 adenylate cyclase/tetratricopeptide (TPR) repeat protein